MMIYGASEIGRVKPRNEDRFLIREFDGEQALVAVMDGMGGQPGGALAARLVRDVLAAFQPDGSAPAEQLHNLVIRANAAVMEEEDRHPDLYGMGTTLTMAWIKQEEAHWAHVGDSRLYHCRGNRLVQVTTDHNMAQFLYREGELTMTEAMESPLRNLLDQALGGSFMEEDSASLTLAPGDRLLLCSDGIHDQIPVERIAAALMDQGGVQSICRSLIEGALEAGGEDNITAVVLEYS